MFIKHENIFTSFLSSLGVKHTRLYSNKCYGEHPNKYNLLGLSQLLSEYGIENKGIQITRNREEVLNSLAPPFIAHTGSDFVNVFKKTKDKIHYDWLDKTIITSPDEFTKIWTGIVLLAEPNENSIEPDYWENRRKELIGIIQQFLLVFAIAVLATICYISNQLHTNLGASLLVIINLIGIYISYLLVLKQMHIQNNYADKICSLFKQSDCNDVLNSRVAKLWGVINWSEVGLSYFTSNLIILLFTPQLITYLTIISICTLPYTIWSIWYQKMKTRQWCPLCLIVQGLLWGIFGINLFFHLIQIPAFEMNQVLMVSILYGTPLLIINFLIPKLSNSSKIEQITQAFNSLKATDEIFIATLKKQVHYQVDKSTSKILFGNKNAETLITILTNPHCEPCAKMHQRIEKLRTETNDRFCFQYIFSSFHADLDTSNKFLIDAYFNNSENYQTIFNEWFKAEKYEKEAFFKKNDFKKENADVLNEFHTHMLWNATNRLHATPTVLINGYEFPKSYKIEDLKYFTHLEVDSK